MCEGLPSLPFVNFCVYECNISALIFVVRGMYGYYFLLGVVLGILLGEVDELEPAIHTLLGPIQE